MEGEGTVTANGHEVTFRSHGNNLYVDSGGNDMTVFVKHTEVYVREG